MTCFIGVDLHKTQFTVHTRTENRVESMDQIIQYPVTNDGYANINFISPESAATCEYLYIILKEMEKEFPSIIDSEVATSLYCGIITDSGNFKNANTTILTKKIAQGA